VVTGLDDKADYCNGRTHAEHCERLDSLAGDGFRVVHMPIGHLLNMAEISYSKRALLMPEMPAVERLKCLDNIASNVFGPVTEAAIAAIEPICDKGIQILSEIVNLPVEKQTQAFRKGDVFRILARLNPSLLTALRLCSLGPIPEQPRMRELQA
jgi:hypothetical protein